MLIFFLALNQLIGYYVNGLLKKKKKTTQWYHYTLNFHCLFTWLRIFDFISLDKNIINNTIRQYIYHNIFHKNAIHIFVSNQIVRPQSAQIFYDSTPGESTVFHLHFLVYLKTVIKIYSKSYNILIKPIKYNL